MVSAISDAYVSFAIAKEIQNAVKQTYSKTYDATQVYEIRLRTMSTKQGTRIVTEYVNELKSLWQELDHYE